MSDHRLAGLRTVVTQCDDFMGPAICALFERAGSHVIADRSNLAEPNAAAELIAEAGHVDVLIANLAAVNPKTSALETTDAEWADMFNIMVHPLHRLVREVLPQMLDRGRGKIVLVGSASALRGMPNWSAYSAARGAQLAFIKAVGIEVAPHGINVNGIAQTFVDNPAYFSEAYQRTPEFRRRMDEVPIGRLATPEEDAEILLFLASDKSDFLVGQIIPFAGGWVV